MEGASLTQRHATRRVNNEGVRICTPCGVSAFLLCLRDGIAGPSIVEDGDSFSAAVLVPDDWAKSGGLGRVKMREKMHERPMIG